jgi:hypothetical protein
MYYEIERIKQRVQTSLFTGIHIKKEHPGNYMQSNPLKTLTRTCPVCLPPLAT